MLPAAAALGPQTPSSGAHPIRGDESYPAGEAKALEVPSFQDFVASVPQKDQNSHDASCDFIQQEGLQQLTSFHR